MVCEGVIENTGIHLCFGTPASQREYKKEFCYNNYQECIIYKALYSKYDD